MPLSIIRNDLTKMCVDAVVVPANESLAPGRGTSAAIFHAAGQHRLTDACRVLAPCQAGTAVITAGFDLPAKYIIHSVCPQWQGGGFQEREILIHSYQSALRLAKNRQLESVAFPLLSSGFYGYPKEEAFTTAVTAIKEFLLEEDLDVFLVLYDHDSVAVSKKLSLSIHEYIDDHYVEALQNFCDAAPLFSPSSDSSIPLAPSHRASSMVSSMPSPQAPASFQSLAEAEKGAKKKTPKARSLRSSVPPFFSLKKKQSLKGLDERLIELDETFSQMLLRLIDEKGLKDSAVYRRANIDRRLFSKIRSNAEYSPAKKTVLAFAISLELPMEETRSLLMKAGYALSNSSKSDVIISYFIENRIYDIFEINEVLFAYGQPILGQ